MAKLLEKLATRISARRKLHQERHTTTGYQFALADRVDLLDGAAWDGLAARGSFFHARPYLRVLEDAGPANVKPRYALISRGRVPVAAMVAQYVEIPGRTLIFSEPDAESRVGKALSRAYTRAKGRALEKLEFRFLVCGDILAWGAPGALFAQGEDPAELWPAITEALYRIHRAEKLAGRTDFLFVKDVPEDDAAAARALEKFSYAPVDSDPDMVLDLSPKWRTFEDYLASLNHKYRKAAKDIFRRVGQGGFKVERLIDLAPHAERLHALYAQVQARANSRYAVLTPGFLPGVSNALGERFRTTAITRNGTVHAFVTTVADGGTAVGYYLGLDYGAMADGPLYLRLLFAVVADALALGCARVSFGRTALEPKARLGARPRAMRVFARHRHPLLRFLVQALQNAVPHDEAPERHPFKT